MFRSKNTFFPRHSYSSPGGKAGCSPILSGWDLGDPSSFLACLRPPLGKQGEASPSVAPHTVPGGTDWALPFPTDQAASVPSEGRLWPQGPGGGPYMEPGECGLWQAPWKKWPCSEGQLRRIINSTASLPLQLAASVPEGSQFKLERTKQDKGAASGEEGERPGRPVVSAAVLRLIKRTVTRAWG